MSAYASWERRDVYISEMSLDPHNPRLPGSGNEPATERSIVAQLIEHEDVFTLAKGIASQGFLPTELLVCVEEQDELVVIEGNRRLASLKLLSTPELAPTDKEIARFRKLVKLSAVSLATQLEVLVAPTRSETVPLVMAKHTREGVRSWEPLQQANYVKTLLDTGVKLEELPSLTGIAKGEILKNLRTHSLYEMATRLPLDKKTRETVLDTRKFPASTLERLSGSRDMKEFLGISFDARGGVVGQTSVNHFAKAYSHIIKDIVNKVVDTRTLNDAKSIQRYIDQLGSFARNDHSSGSFTSESFLADTPSEAPPETASVPPKRRLIRRSTALIPRAFKCYLDMPRIESILEELQTLKVEKFENATAVMLRIFVELSMSHYLDSTGRMEALVARIDKKGQKPKDWTPSLRQMLGDILSNDKTIKIPRQARKALDKAVSNEDYPLSLDGLDQFVHNLYVSPSEKQLRQFWNSYEKLVAHFMQVHDSSEHTDAL